jgi:hypothetical protein
MSVELIEVEPGKWRVKRANTHADLRSDLPCPQIISDIMPPTEQVDGRFYESKSAFRAVGKANGLIEVGNEKLPPRQRATNNPAVQKRRREAIGKAIQQFKAGAVRTDSP